MDSVGEGHAAEVRISHSIPSFFPFLEPGSPRFRREIAYTAFELSLLPSSLVDSCDQADEIWVPSTFCRQVLIASGLQERKVYVVPHGVDCQRFDPARVSPMEISNTQGKFCFLSIFQWEHRKGWDVLLRAYRKAFSRTDPVLLLVAATPRSGDPMMGTSHRVKEAVRREMDGLHWNADTGPEVSFLQGQFPDKEMPTLFAAADAFVLPSRGEGFGLPLLEAMAMGLPTLGTDWGGARDFLTTGVAYPIPVKRLCPVEDGIAAPYDLCVAGAHMAEPDEDALVELLRHVFNHRDDARETGRRAREHVKAHWSWGRAADAAICRLSDASATGASTAKNGEPTSPGCIRRTAADSQPTQMVLEGSLLVGHSLAKVNRELACALLGRSEVDLRLVPYEAHTMSVHDDERFPELLSRLLPGRSLRSDVHIRHRYPPSFVRPHCSTWVLMQPWEYGAIPQEWARQIRGGVDRVWVPSEVVREMFVDSGVSEHKLSVVPLGVNPSIYTPTGGVLGIPSNRPFRFLFVGGGLPRKGVDLLLEAYGRAFARKDDVSLIIKASDAGGRYRQDVMQQAVSRHWGRRGSPEVVVLQSEYSDGDMASLYRSCHAYVQPFRGEGFGLPILEAMACGLPVIVSGGGAADDFVLDQLGVRIPSRRAPLPGTMAKDLDLCGPGWWLHPDVDALVDALRWAAGARTEARAMGQRAAAAVRSGWTWQHSAEKALRTLGLL
jgi:glycosyltransferase involved in cell wall biosynthesis